MYEREFPSLAACVSYLAVRFPYSSLHESRDIDSGEMVRGARFPRWLFRGEAECYPTSSSGLVRLRASRPLLASEIETVADFAHHYVTHQLVLPYLAEVRTITSLEWLAVAATYEGLAFCQHYGLPTALIDFTSSLRVAAQFASAAPVGPSGAGRIAVLDVERSRSCSQIWDFRDLSPTRAARQRAYGLYKAGHPDLCDPDVRRQIGLTWFRFRHDSEDDLRWRKGFRQLLATRTDRLAGWVRHAIAIYARRETTLSLDAADLLLARIPLVPLLAKTSKRRGYGGFLTPATVRFDAVHEHRRSLRDWTRARERCPNRPIRTYRRVGRSLVRFVGT